MTVAIIVGHDSKRRGASLNLNSTDHEMKTYEYDWNSAVAKQIDFLRHIYKLDVSIHYRDKVGIYGAYLAAMRKNPDFILELHFNSDRDNKIEGAEVLCAEPFKNHPFIKPYLARCVKMFGGKNRGVKVPSTKDRGYGNVKRPVPYLLLEPFFGSSPKQAKIAADSSVNYAILIMNTLKEIYESNSSTLT